MKNLYSTTHSFLLEEKDYSMFYPGYTPGNTYLFCEIKNNTIVSIFSTNSKNKSNSALWDYIEVSAVNYLELKALLQNCITNKYLKDCRDLDKEPKNFSMYSEDVLEYLLNNNRISKEYYLYQLKELASV